MTEPVEGTAVELTTTALRDIEPPRTESQDLENLQLQEIERKTAGRRQDNKWMVCALVGVLVVILVTVMAVVIPPEKSQKESTSSNVGNPPSKPISTPTLSPVKAPTMPPVDSGTQLRFQEVKQLMQSISGGPVFDDHTSPHYQAAMWLAKDDPAQLDFEISNFTTAMQRYVLALLYYATNGANWKDSYQFLTADHVCAWKKSTGGGVKCNVNQFVIEIDIDNNNLEGKIPYEISAIGTLEHLVLSKDL